ARTLQRSRGQWHKGKGLDTFCPLGPCIVTRDEIPDWTSLEISLYVNDELRQRARTADMVFGIPTLIADLSAGMTLEPGDILATGTCAGCGFAFDPPRYLQPGDVVRCEISGIGTLTNTVREPA
ncbi:MAG TPA: fumarylacetoacetate hydrolase family protein, partial [Bacillota bacterium]